MENIRGSDLPDSHALNTWLEIMTEELIQFYKGNKEQQKTLNRVDNFPEQLCSGNGKQKLYNTSNNTYKSKKTDVEIKIEDNVTYSVYVKPGFQAVKLLKNC